VIRERGRTEEAAMGRTREVVGLGMLALQLGGCVTAFCHAAPLARPLLQPQMPPFTADECLKGFKEHEEWLARPVAPPGQCPGTSVWNGAGCSTSTDK
jgi:hypothetical protein